MKEGTPVTSAVDRAYAWLRARIMTGTLPSGTFIDEASVCEGAKVSRTPVREAFHRLAGERVLELVPRRGALVRGVTARDVIEAYNARWLIESAAVKHVLAHEIDVIAEMQVHLDEMERIGLPTSEEDHFRSISADRLFHATYVASMGNGMISQFYDSLWPVHEWSSIREQNAPSAFGELVAQQHREIFESLARRDEHTTLKVLSEHLQPFGNGAHGQLLAHTETARN